VHHVLYEWSELVELDKHVVELERAIESIDQLAKSLYKTDNKHLYNSTLISIKNELKQQLEDILSQFTNPPTK
jgi:Mg2+ and Co2+ transporter CorA|tara:strand:+ start:650 stop:868 length:219 start_codon:yes stop_codon:yes gene_type:complete